MVHESQLIDTLVFPFSFDVVEDAVAEAEAVLWLLSEHLDFGALWKVV